MENVIKNERQSDIPCIQPHDKSKDVNCNTILYTHIDEAVTWLYKIGKSFARMGDIVNAARFLSDAFFLRGRRCLSGTISDWKLFHDVQFSMYLMGRKNMMISLPEGDMVHDLIEQRWNLLQEENQCSEFPFLCTDKKAWYSTIIIDFPWQTPCSTTPSKGSEDQECVSLCSKESTLRLFS
ncbi:hypothetical protein [Parasphaerochaeta coccoides]|nr:hypothetical protein [Parasphaerochaeta coccoides]